MAIGTVVGSSWELCWCLGSRAARPVGGYNPLGVACRRKERLGQQPPRETDSAPVPAGGSDPPRRDPAKRCSKLHRSHFSHCWATAAATNGVIWHGKRWPAGVGGNLGARRFLGGR